MNPNEITEFQVFFTSFSALIAGIFLGYAMPQFDFLEQDVIELVRKIWRRWKR